MKCYKCGKKPIENSLIMFPIDPKGTKNRRWECEKCMTNEEKENIPADVLDFEKELENVLGRI